MLLRVLYVPAPCVRAAPAPRLPASPLQRVTPSFPSQLALAGFRVHRNQSLSFCALPVCAAEMEQYRANYAKQPDPPHPGAPGQQ